MIDSCDCSMGDDGQSPTVCDACLEREEEVSEMDATIDWDRIFREDR